MRGGTLVLFRLALLAAVLLLWEALPRFGLVNAMLLPPLSDVLAALAHILGRADVHTALGVTAAEVVVAFVIAVPLGAALGVLSAENEYFGDIFKPMLFYVFSIPKSIFLPMFILVFGIGFPQKVAYATFSTVFIVIMSAAAAVESVKAEHLLVARSYGATQAQILRRVYLPSMLPILLEALRISMIFNFTGVMIAEMYASRVGIGRLIADWGENFEMTKLLAGVILLAAAAMAFNEAVRSLEARCSTWRA
ncbi:MAG TPA: ABC transporter permease subunit [Pseudolabrys sp.]|nr:ABC transporter permease subunit [Pseudolabrys sp.]